MKELPGRGAAVSQSLYRSELLVGRERSMAICSSTRVRKFDKHTPRCIITIAGPIHITANSHIRIILTVLLRPNQTLIYRRGIAHKVRRCILN